MNQRKRIFALLAALGILPAPHAPAQLEEVIVTAQKREEGLQDVPISVQAFSAETIDNLAAQDLGDLDAFTPNVEIPRQTNQPNYKIRGLGTSEFGVGGDPVVGVYLDGIYIARGGGSKVAFNDIQRVEILNGPQGTLFGRNAAAGAIQYITNQPREEREGRLKLTAGNYRRIQLEGIYNLPLGERLYWRSGLLSNQREGFVENDHTGADHLRQDNWSIVTALRWLPSDGLDVTLRLEYDEVDQDSKAVASAIYGRNRHAGAKFDTTTTDRRLEEARELFGASMHLSYELPEATFTSIGSYRAYETVNPENQDGWIDPSFRFDDFNSEDNQQYSQEFRFSGESFERLLWTAGATWHEETARQTSAINLHPLAVERVIMEREAGLRWGSQPLGTGFNLAWAFEENFARLPRAFDSGAQALAADNYNESIHVRGDYESWALFADFTYELARTLSLTVGGRYTEDSKKFSRLVEVNDFGIFFAFTPTWLDSQGNYAPNGSRDPDGLRIGRIRQEGEWDELTSRAVLDWSPSDDVMLYASWAQGYNAGGFNSVGLTNDAPAYDPASVDNLEFGLKSAWLDDSLRFNAAYFSYDYQNLQELNLIPAVCLPESSFSVHMFETSDIEGEGLELALEWAPLAGLELWGTLGTRDAEYTERIRQREKNGVCDPVDDSGERFGGEPEAAVGASYTYDMGRAGELSGSLSYGWRDGHGRDSCAYVQQLPDGTGAYYQFDTDEGELAISRRSAVGTLTEPPIDECPAREDRERLNARLAYTSSGGEWRLSAWVTNWLNWLPQGDPGGLGRELASDFTDGAPSYTRREPPRMYGMALQYSF